MKTIVKTITNSVICTSLLAVLLGIVLVAYPGMTLFAIGVAIAAYLIVHGIALVILDIKAWRLYIPFEGLLQGILCIILGVLLAKNPASIADYFGIVMGLWIIVTSFGSIKAAAALRGTGAPWVLMIIINLIDIIIGGLVLYFPTLSSLAMTICIGIVLIVHSVISIIYMLVIRKNSRDLEMIIIEKGNLNNDVVDEQPQVINEIENEENDA